LVGVLLRRTGEGDEVLAEWSRSDDASVATAKKTYRDWLDQDYEAVQSDGTFFEPIEEDVFPVDAEQVILSTGMGGG
jgi:hypothetical protein